MKHPDVRILSLEERILMARRHDEYGDLQELLKTDLYELLHCADRVHELTALLAKYNIPTLSTEIVEEDCVALYDRTGEHPDIVLDYLGVLNDSDGQQLQRLFNLGQLTSLSRPNVRPMTTIRLTVPEEEAVALEEVHCKWYRQSICMQMVTPDGSYWITPGGPLHADTSQRYVVTPATEKTPAHNSGMSRVTPKQAAYVSWELQMHEYFERHPDKLELIPYFEFYLLPRHRQVELGSKAPKGMLTWMKDTTLYRVVGLTPQGVLQLTDRLHQDLIFNQQVFIIDALETGDFEVVK